MANKETTTVDTNAQAAAPAAAAPAAPAAPSKMSVAKELFKGLRDGSIPLMEGKTTQRATFIATMQQPEHGMSQSGAATYWQNLISQERGGKLYPHTGGKKKTEGAAPKTDGPAEDAVPADTKAEGDAQAPAEDAQAEGGKDENDLSHLES